MGGIASLVDRKVKRMKARKVVLEGTLAEKAARGSRNARSRRFRGHELPKCGLTGKRRYRDQTQAGDGLMSARWRGLREEFMGVESTRREVRVYPCGWCGGWHATSQPLKDVVVAA